MERLQRQQVTIVGLGKSGLAAAKFCHRRGALVQVMDHGRSPDLEQRAAELKALGIAVDLGGHDADALAHSSLIVLSPGVPHTLAEFEAARNRGVRIIGEIELASSFIQQPIVAITGANGKSTVTTLVGKMLQHSKLEVFVGGNIGNPLIEYVDQEQQADVLVVEVSSFQLDTIEHFRPKVSVLLNITPDHLDRYPDFHGYAESKSRIFLNQTAADFAVLNGSDPVVAPFTAAIKARPLHFDRFPTEIDQWFGTPGLNQQFGDSPLPGKHNRENIAAAALASAAAGASAHGILAGLKNFTGLKHRIEYVTEKNGVRFFDDSKATNLDAAQKAIESFTNPVIAIMGGRGKGYRFDGLFDAVRKHVKKLILMGETRHEIAEDLGKAPSAGYQMAGTMDQAVREAFKASEPGDIILLAPACASFDMFSGYAERGDKFCQAARAL